VLLVDQNSPILWANAGVIVVDHLVFRLSITFSVAEILVIRVYNYPKSHALLILGGSKWDYGTFLLVDQSSPIFFSSNVGEVVVDHSDIHDQTLKLSKIAPNFARFCPPKF